LCSGLRLGRLVGGLLLRLVWSRLGLVGLRFFFGRFEKGCWKDSGGVERRIIADGHLPYRQQAQAIGGDWEDFGGLFPGVGDLGIGLEQVFVAGQVFAIYAIPGADNQIADFFDGIG
jgi:hypothetical protein